MSDKLSESDLAQFSGTESYHRWNQFARNHVLTDGTMYLAEKAGAYWLMDAIASHWPTVRKNADAASIAFWELKKNPHDNGAVLTCRSDSGRPAIVRQNIEYTDFPLDSIKLYCTAGGPQDTQVICLPSEY